jgi:hypothetical protein
MRKKKENIAFNAQRLKDGEVPADMAEAIETAREEHMEEISGENATDELGPGYTTSEGEHEAVTSVDGPIAGDGFSPPTRKRRGQAKRHKKKKSGHPTEWLEKGNHTAARSTKKL